MTSIWQTPGFGVEKTARAWQEIRMVHIIKLKDLESISQARKNDKNERQWDMFVA
jgi:hypothetical protein